VDLIQAMGAYATISVEQIGSYAGFAAVLGLAVLSALYFSQARDVKRLREWAGRAPERDAEARARVAAATAAGQQRQQTGAAQPTPATAQPAAANAGGGNSGGATETPAPAQAPAVAGAAAASKAPAVAGGPAAASSGAGAHGGVASPSRPLGPGGSRPSGATSILTPQAEPHERWYRRIAPKYIALIVAGVLVVGGGIAVGAIQLLSGDDSSGGGETAQPAAVTETSSRAPIRPADVSVAVLNATPVQGLANQFGDRAQAEGFKKDNVGNAPGAQQRAESVVLFAPGKEREARLVRRRFNVSNIEPVDEESKALAPQADVILVVGADNTQ
jgi:hypothetical protein